MFPTPDYIEIQGVIDEGKPLVVHDLETLGVHHIEKQQHSVRVSEEVPGQNLDGLVCASGQVPKRQIDPPLLQNDDLVVDVILHDRILRELVRVTVRIVRVILESFEEARLAHSGRPGQDQSE